MATNSSTITVSVKVAWWVEHYVYLLLALNNATGYKPSDKHIERMVMMGISVKPDSYKRGGPTADGILFGLVVAGGYAAMIFTFMYVGGYW